MYLIAKGLVLFKICFKQVQFWEQKRSYGNVMRKIKGKLMRVIEKNEDFR